LLTASAGENADLFWAIRGGGGNFGVVTSFEFRLHAVGPTVLGGMVLYPIEQAKEVLQFYREFARSGPDDLIAFASLLTSPEGVPMVAIIAGWFGPLEQGEAYLKPLRSFGPPLVDMIAPIPYLQLQTTFDAAVPYGMHRYWKSGYFQQLTDDLIDTIISHTIEKPSPFSTVVFFHIHGAATRISPQATAFGLRQDQWDIDLISQWRDAEENDLHISWTRRFWKAIEPLSQGVYVNHLDTDDGTPRVRAAYQTNYEKLVELKNRYDSTNFFRLNNNIAPTPPS
jgi:hypothetical protein